MSKITVKEAIIATAQALDMQEGVTGYLSGTDAAGEADTENLLRCFNLVESALALEYLPLYAEEELVTQTGAVYYDELTRAPVRVLRVRDEWDNLCAFKLFPDYLKTQSGKVKVCYSYLPDAKGLEDKSDFTLQASLQLFVYGMATEYTLSCGRFEEAAVWDKKYKDAIAAAYRAKPCKKMRARRWA